MTVRLASKPGQRQVGGEIGLSETCPVSTKQEKKAPIIQFYYLLFIIQYSVLLLVSPVPTREVFLSNTQKKEENKKKEREREKKAPCSTGMGRRKEGCSFKKRSC